MANRVRFLVLVPLCAAVLMPGCKTSPTPAKVSGKITYNGSPIGGGSINFHPVTTEGGGNIMFNVKPDGTYEGVDLPVGDCVVTVETESLNPNPDRPKGEMAGGGGKFDPNDFMNKMKEAGNIPGTAGQKQGTYTKIPPKYTDVKTSPLKVTLTKGNNKNDFNLTD